MHTCGPRGSCQEHSWKNLKLILNRKILQRFYELSSNGNIVCFEVWPSELVIWCLMFLCSEAQQLLIFHLIGLKWIRTAQRHWGNCTAFIHLNSCCRMFTVISQLLTGSQVDILSCAWVTSVMWCHFLLCMKQTRPSLRQTDFMFLLKDRKKFM